MDKNSLNTNKQFMIGNGILAFGVLAVVIIFLYMSFRFKRDANKVVTYEGVYNIEVSKDFAGDSIAIYVNDSLLMNRTMPDASLKTRNQSVCRRECPNGGGQQNGQNHPFQS